jgi:putative ABC transport system ATP-binding protein
VTAVLEATDVHRSFGATPALRGVDLIVAEGELLAIMGPSGAGQSTTPSCAGQRRVPLPVPLLLAGRRRGAAVANAAQWLERLGIDDLQARRPGELSGGQAQRVALARALSPSRRCCSPMSRPATDVAQSRGARRPTWRATAPICCGA